MTPAVFEPTILVNQQFHRTATEIGLEICLPTEMAFENSSNKISRNEYNFIGLIFNKTLSQMFAVGLCGGIEC
jgi:hypothetical protein